MDNRDAAAQAIVEKYLWWSVGAGMIPIPLVDFAAVTAVNLRMLRELSAVYGVDFSEDKAKAAIGSLTAGLATGVLGQSRTVASALKTIPVVGQTVASVAASVIGAGTTYATGRVFVQHYASGGTLLDFNPESVRAFFKEQYEKGKRFVTRRPAAGAEPSPA